METVNVECGHCGKLMAVSTEHLGARVSCPHCQGVVEAPALSPRAANDPPEINVPTSDSPESIFASPETEAAEDIFGTQHRPTIEMPTAPEPESVTHSTLPDLASPPDALAKPATTNGEHAPWSVVDKAVADAPADSTAAPDNFGQRRYVAKRSMLVPILLMFLIPYCLFTTGFLAWLLYNRSKAPEPFEYLKDPAPGKDGPEKKARGPERIKYDARLPAKLRTPLRKPIQVGDVEITPLKVVQTSGDLAIQLTLRNLSADTAFNPLPDAFADPRTFGANKPYTFLEAGPDDYLFGGSVTYRRGKQKNLFQSGKLGPGEETTATLTTDVGARSNVARILRANRAALLWRIQVRRGLVTVDGAPMSATAVIGVEFPTSAIEKERS